MLANKQRIEVSPFVTKSVRVVAGLGSAVLLILTIVLWESVRPFFLGEASPWGDVRPSASWKYTFNIEGVLEEAPTEEESSSPYFWLSSGGELLIENDVGRTLTGALPQESPWRIRYGAGNALDTDEGRYPQNIFRLITRSAGRDIEQFLSFRIEAIHTTRTPNRGPWSGLFLMGRLNDNDNLYYMGLRQDGTAVIKKKISGTYYTLAQTPVFVTGRPYDADTNPNLIPGKVWMGLRTRIYNDGVSVRLELFIDRGEKTGWELLLAAIDEGRGGPPHLREGRSGIRSDFMDVSFDNFAVNVL